MEKVRVWEENVIIPTYPVGEPEKNPVFIEKRVYQGSSGSVYPYPVIEKIHDEKVNKEYIGLFLENEYVKIMVLPELGGRVQMAYDKTKKRHFVYYNQVIKPALVGLTGPWISGGIEFNWPQHHRPTTFDPLDFYIERNEDGSATVWCSELERMFRIKGTVGFTLYPDRSFLEIRVKVYNGTAFPQTFLWWANPAVKVNDHYQSVFPPDVHAVYDHGKRDVSEFPIAKGTYYKVDYSPGTDISRYKNIPVPTSYMAAASKYDFIGGYENDTEAGILHVANHHISPGKKQWTWGNGDFGRAWDRNLTDKDGPYIELMCGVYTDNQPDFSWLMPGEQREFVQYFIPYRDLGVVKNATKNAMVNMEIEGNKVCIKAYTTGVYPNCQVKLMSANNLILEDKYNASPYSSYCKELELLNGISQELLKVVILDQHHNKLVSWQWQDSNENGIPEPAKPAEDPQNIGSSEELYLTGLHIEQYRHATYDPVDYYLEVIKRDPNDVRSNNAMGLWLLKRAKFKQAEKYFNQAIERLTEKNPNPYDGEPYFNLGMALKYQNEIDAAYDAFYKSTWNFAWQNQGFFRVAQIDVIRKDWENALTHINKSISKNTQDQNALHLKIAILRHLKREKEALRLAEDVIREDTFNFGALYEKYLLTSSPEDLELFHRLIRKNIHNYIEYSLLYASAGLFDEAIDLLIIGSEQLAQESNALSWYYLGWYCLRSGMSEEAEKIFKVGASANPDYCFPNQVESVIALSEALKVNGTDAKALYYLGNFWYHAQQYKEAINCWEKSVAIDSIFPTAFRNLALGYFNKLGKKEIARQYMEKAFELDSSDARILMELDQLYKRLNKDIKERLDFLQNHIQLTNSRDDVYLERIVLHNILGEYNKAFQLIKSRKFHPWEGGEGKVTGQYVITLVSLAKVSMNKGDFEMALDYLKQSLEYPHNLGEGKLYGYKENDIYYWMGIVFEKMGASKKAMRCWEKASLGDDEPNTAVFYNDQHPDKIIYQGLALLKLNRPEKANQKFKKLIDYGESHLKDKVKIDYFAISLPDLMIWEDDLNRKNQIQCLYLIALGLLGLKSFSEAVDKLKKVLTLDKSHQGAIIHKKMIEDELENKLLP